MVRLAFYYTLRVQNISPEYYEEIKENYPQLFIQDLIFDGEIYTLYFIEDDKEYTFKYKYLKRFDGTLSEFSFKHINDIRYVLVNDNEVTWEQIVHGMASSTLGDAIDHKIVYSKIIFENFD